MDFSAGLSGQSGQGKKKKSGSHFSGAGGREVDFQAPDPVPSIPFSVD